MLAALPEVLSSIPRKHIRWPMAPWNCKPGDLTPDSGLHRYPIVPSNGTWHPQCQQWYIMLLADTLDLAWYTGMSIVCHPCMVLLYIHNSKLTMRKISRHSKRGLNSSLPKCCSLSKTMKWELSQIRRV